ncbi:DUF6538 domain-containing protein [Sphingobium sp. DN12]|uniref:DUF6538 domain-containing protein n=1 Tax=Sphingobium sp. DN12 TaxID=3378073 RepID=UPI003DA3F840
MSYLAKRGAVCYFRRIVPDDLRLALGKREIMLSLRTKDREDAKRLIPKEFIKSDALFAAARKQLQPNAMPAPADSPFANQARRAAFEQAERKMLEDQEHWEQTEGARQDFAELELIDWWDSLPDTPLGKAIKADAGEQVAIAKMEGERAALAALKSQRASEAENQAVDCDSGKPVAGRGVYLDTDIVDLWAAERSPAAKTKDSYRRVAEWLHERIGRKSVEQFTRKDMLAFKDRLLADGQTPQNVNVKLGNLRTLLQWAVDNDYAESNAAIGIVLKAPANKRMTYGLADLQSLFSSPVYADGARPKQGRGEAAYWLPVLALFTGARMKELGQLRVGDIKQADYPDADNKMRSCWGLHFVADTDDNGQVTRLKNAESERFVPLHPELERLGFLKYVKGLTDKKGRIFPELKAGAYGRQSAKWGEWYGRYVDSDTGITDRRITFHSFRHTFKDYCRLASIEEPLANRLMGHKTQGVAASYGLGYGLHNLVQAIRRYKVPGLEIPAPKPAATDTQ